MATYMIADVNTDGCLALHELLRHSPTGTMATDLQLAVLSAAVYSDEEPEDGPAAGFHIYKSIGRDESGLGASLYIKKTEVRNTATQACIRI